MELRVPEHSIYGFLGKNGAGKTTAMKAVLGLVKPDAGEIRLLGEPVRCGRTETNRHVGYLPDVPAFYPFLTAREYLGLCARCAGMEERQGRVRGEELLERVGLAGERGRIGGYSRGMK